MKNQLDITEMTLEQQFVLREVLISKSVKELKYNFKLMDKFNKVVDKERTYNSTYRRLIKVCNELVEGKVIKRNYVYVPKDKSKTGKFAIMYLYQIHPKWRAENSVDLKKFKFCNYLLEYSTNSTHFL